MGHAAHQTTVLLVEDEALISALVADSLMEHGFAVHEASTADEALRYMDGGGEVDVLFTDVNLPGGMDGAELANRARQRRPELPIVYASGRYGCSDLGLVPRSVFLMKPYDTGELCTLIERLTVPGPRG
ncbi:MAG TPA: response regulator [Pseudolabrys sp.]|jgi:CheY-like chemotaxis protein|nr:response regulator [Pseudolabrys sp.]